ncbi:LacI family DNA-binding transcriptional regulator [Endozoicomonas euniceicola]|uniref:Substrate-binding domain-containing protein n=1 Tax=Endozoicomonas euniceicola TaxID=1234143 RepID=A0ABY6GZ03_9GAMM|nr:substrate-binding domain-containing protein [Endozoicomonas euniceicola]UYM18020.1 substrate-binding domain-containing protein [Endozoicomonas euniceicola]
MTSIKDVAREANVSTATVSRVINRQSNTSSAVTAAVHQAIAKLGYKVSSTRQAAAAMGVMVSDVSEPFFGQIIKGVEAIARKNDKRLFVLSSQYSADTERQTIRQLMSHCDHAIIHSKWLPDEELVEYASQMPGLVLINRYIKSISHRCIALDNVYGGYIATRHLLNKGHRNIGCLCSEQNIDDAVDRLKGYKQALTEYGIAIDEQFITSSYPSEEGGRLGTYNLLAKKLTLTAIVAYNDVMAAGALSALAENGIQCPESVSVVGFDDLIIASYLNPRLSTVRYPAAAMAEQAARLSLKLTSQDAPMPREHVLIPTFVERSSTSALTPQTPFFLAKSS